MVTPRGQCAHDHDHDHDCDRDSDRDSDDSDRSNPARISAAFMVTSEG
jgi:hypothetical protein